MLAKFDTLLVRLLASMAIAVAGTLVFSFLLVKMQQSVRSGPPKTPMSVAVEALETLRDDGWPDPRIELLCGQLRLQTFEAIIPNATRHDLVEVQ